MFMPVYSNDKIRLQYLKMVYSWDRLSEIEILKNSGRIRGAPSLADLKQRLTFKPKDKPNFENIKFLTCKGRVHSDDILRRKKYFINSADERLIFCACLPHDAALQLFSWLYFFTTLDDFALTLEIKMIQETWHMNWSHFVSAGPEMCSFDNWLFPFEGINPKDVLL